MSSPFHLGNLLDALPPRPRRYGVVLVLLALVFAIGLLRATWDVEPGRLTSDSHLPPGPDFITFHAAARLAADGRVADVWDPDVLLERQRAIVRDPDHGASGVLPWLYPPTYLLAVRPLAGLGYLPALLLFLGLSVVALLASLRVAGISPSLMPVVLIFPGCSMAVATGQNGLLTAALAVGALAWLERRPVAAGVLIGLLTFKPHLAVVLVIALIAGGRWRALLVAGLTTLSVTMITIALWGVAPWLTFAETLAHASSGTGLLDAPLQRMVSMEAALLNAGLPGPWARAIQAVCSLGVLGVVVYVWRNCADWRLRGATVLIATPLCVPLFYDYDTVALMVASLWLTRDLVLRGGSRIEAAAPVTAFAFVLVLFYARQLLGDWIMILAPLAIACVLGVTVRRALGRI